MFINTANWAVRDRTTDMLADYSILLIGAILVNNFVLVQFLGLCPFMGVSNKLETAMGMSMATTFVLTLASACSNLTYHLLLQPLGLEYLKTISFILVIAVVVSSPKWWCANPARCSTAYWGSTSPSSPPTARCWAWPC